MRSVIFAALWVVTVPLGCITWGNIGDDGVPCQCIPYVDHGWYGPDLLWTGVESDAPTCPQQALDSAWSGYSDLKAAHECDCRCEPPATAECELPYTFAANAVLCADVTMYTPKKSFSSPSFSWDGACSTANAIPMNAPCTSSGSAGPCVSLSIAPTILEEMDCVKATDPTANLFTQPQPRWGTFGKACRAAVGEPCKGGRDCAVTADGFSQCLFKDGVHDCPEHWTVQHIFHRAFEDTRSCSPCSCGKPVGSTCTTEVSVYSNSTCAGTPLLVYYPVSSAQWECFNLLVPGAALGSKKATPAVYTPGTCEPIGGEPVGGVVPIEPRTYCCLPPDYEAE